MQQVKGVPRSNFVDYGSRGYQDYAKRVNASQGHSGGFPNAFRHHPSTWAAGTGATKEWINPANHEVSRISQVNHSAITGRYQSMVPDLPFNDIHEQKKRKALNHAGLASMATGAAFLL